MLDDNNEGLVQERHNSIANVLELHLSSTPHQHDDADSLGMSRNFCDPLYTEYSEGANWYNLVAVAATHPWAIRTFSKHYIKTVTAIR